MSYKNTIETDRWMVNFTNEWTQLVGKYAWVNFTPIKIYMEKDNHFGNLELEVFLLGFGVRVVYSYLPPSIVQERYAEANALLGIDKPKKKS